MVNYLREGTCWAFTEGAVRVKFSLDTDVTWQLSEGDCNHRDKRPVLPGATGVSVNCITAPGTTAEERGEKKASKHKLKTKSGAEKIWGFFFFLYLEEKKNKYIFQYRGSGNVVSWPTVMNDNSGRRDESNSKRLVSSTREGSGRK